MRIAVPTMARDGLNDQVCGHFGRAPTFTIVDVETDEVEIIDNSAEHFGGMRKTPALIKEAGADAVLCSGVGPLAIHMFEDLGIHVFVGASGSVDSAIQAFKSGSLQEATDENACDRHRRR